jgi:hypothetical protein
MNKVLMLPNPASICRFIVPQGRQGRRQENYLLYRKSLSTKTPELLSSDKSLRHALERE